MICYSGFKDFLDNKIDFIFNYKQEQIYNQLKDICLKEIIPKIITQFPHSNDQKQNLYSGEAYFIEQPAAEDDMNAMNIGDSTNERIIKILLITNLKNQV